MDLVSLDRRPPTIFVNSYPVLWPCLDSILVDTPEAYDLAERWQTNIIVFDKALIDYLVYLPDQLLRPVHFAAHELGLDFHGRTYL